jgi:hypothetical protein
MNATLKTRWLAALRSGTYPHVRLFLRTPAGYCALGVLCDQLEGTWHPEVNYQGLPFFAYQEDGDEMAHNGLLTEDILDRIGLTDAQQMMISMLSDSGEPFADIADWIEEHC